MSWVRSGDRFRTLALRLALTYAVSFGLTAAAGLAILYGLVRSHTLNAVDQELVTRKDEIARALKTIRLADLGAEFAADTEAYGRKDYFIRLLDRQGRAKVSSDTSDWPAIPFSPDILAKLQEGAPSIFDMPLPPPRHRGRVLLARLGSDEYIQLGVSLKDSERFLSNFEHYALIILASMISIGTLTGWWLARKAMSGVEAVTRTAEGIAGGDFSTRVHVAGYGREIEDLVRTFNRMADHVETLMEQMRQVNDNIAHDLRSPITSIRGQAEAGIVTGSFGAEGAELAGSIVEECDRLIQMINTMLDISETETGVQGLKLARLDPGALVSEVVEIFRPVAEDKGIRLETDLAPDRSLLCDRRRLQRALANLLDNALKYTPAGGEVRVSLAEEQGEVVIGFADNGLGILPADLPRIFERFYRGDQSRQLPGSGLGLSLVRAIVNAHGGRVSVESEPGQGSRFLIFLPQA